LENGGIGDVRQVQMLAGMVARDATTTQTATRLALAAKAAAADAESRWTQQVSDADTVTDQLARLQDLLTQQQALLDQATAQVKELQAVRDAAARVAAVRAAAMSAGVVAAQSAVPLPVPPAYAALYKSAAATCPGLSWKVLAAIGQVETRHGQGSVVSSAGALGPMQFMPATFARYATDGDGDGKADIMDPADAIFTAARYLCANSAGLGGQHLHDALWHYNHAEWYVDLVLSLAAKIS
jgi:membrane-bound lytic murein transglycosylase B